MRYLDSRDDILAAFADMRDELDEHNDRRERLIKASRDVTILAKRVIFLLHRLVTEASRTDPDAFSAAAAQGCAKLVEAQLVTEASRTDPDAFSAAAAQGRAKLVEAQSLFRTMREDLQGDRFWRYQQAVSPGLQEYIEALALAHYFETGLGKLIGYSGVQESLCAEDGEKLFPLPMDDYLLGVSDVTGELMRFAITSIGRRGGRGTARAVSDFVRNCKAAYLRSFTLANLHTTNKTDFEGFTPYVRHLGKKQAVTTQSLQKIEDAAYAIVVRTSEYDLPEDLLDDIVERCVSDVRRGSRRPRGGEYDGPGEDMSEEEY
ncbi:Translin [Sanghuangporus baumii]|uniref:Translin n=1 Tax=Sanghuangporus baumii TaxID=108892 RepID=A0A9Q5N9B1_SANBA|nr:Translin [Sanghuangporus baumii]